MSRLIFATCITASLEGCATDRASESAPIDYTKLSYEEIHFGNAKLPIPQTTMFKADIDDCEDFAQKNYEKALPMKEKLSRIYGPAVDISKALKLSKKMQVVVCMTGLKDASGKGKGWVTLQSQTEVQDSKDSRGPVASADEGSTEDASVDKLGSRIDEIIKKRIVEAWARPPSARRGMLVVLRINMLPDGTITSVSVAKPSGDAPFDNAAMEAVKSISPVSEFNMLKTSEYQPYRSFTITLTPDNLTL